jgi:hypothetical protein
MNTSVKIGLLATGVRRGEFLIVASLADALM